jgi:RES domain-containing protein
VIHDRTLLEELEKLSAAPWEGLVFRHMFGEAPPDRENRRGARWNPPEVPAIYTSIHRDVALAEAEYQIRNQPIRPWARRVLYHINVRLSSVLDLTDKQSLLRVGITDDKLLSLDHSSCQLVGGAVNWLGHDGLLVLSARAQGLNLIIYPNQQTPGYEFRQVDMEEIEKSKF